MKLISLVILSVQSIRLNPSRYNCKVFHLVEESDFSQSYGTNKMKVAAELCRYCAGTGYIPCSSCDYDGCIKCNHTGLTECRMCGGSGVWNRYKNTSNDPVDK